MRKNHVSFSPKMSRSKDDRTFVIDISHSNNSHIVLSYVMHSRPQTNFSRPFCVHVILCTYSQASRDSSSAWFSRPNHHQTLELGGEKKVSGLCNTFHFKQDCSVDLHHPMVN